jgi:hypothetical protein
MKRLLVIASLWAPCAALALDSVSVEAGHGTGNTNLFRAGLQWHGHDNWFEHTNWHVARYIDLAFGGWNNGHQTVYDLGFTPVFRLERAKGQPYLEAAIGFHAISNLEFDSGHETSTRFQFGDHIGVGFWLDNRNDLTFRLQHLSNGGIRNPNPGINFIQIRLQHYLR